MILLLVCDPLTVRAAELPREVSGILEDGGGMGPASEWSLEGLLARLGETSFSGLKEPLRFMGRALLYLLVAGAVGLLAAGGWARCIDAVAVLGFAAISLSAMMDLTAEVCRTAVESQTYLAVFVPAYSGVAMLNGQTAGAAAYSGLFFAMSGFLSTVIQRILLPVLQIYFCFSVCAAVWNEPGIGQAASLFSKCFSWLLKGCGGLFGTILGLQSVLTGVSDHAALRVGKSVLSGAVPIVGDVASAALSGAAASLQLLKGSMAMAAAGALGAAFLPVFLRCLLYTAAFCAAGVAASVTGQKRCGQICTLYAEGAQLCGAVLVLYFFMVFLSTTLLLITGNGGG